MIEPVPDTLHLPVSEQRPQPSNPLSELANLMGDDLQVETEQARTAADTRLKNIKYAGSSGKERKRAIYDSFKTRDDTLTQATLVTKNTAEVSREALATLVPDLPQDEKVTYSLKDAVKVLQDELIVLESGEIYSELDQDRMTDEILASKGKDF